MGTKEYKIVINGIEESIEAVASLNRQLSDLEARITEIEKKQIKISTSISSGSGSGGGSGKSAKSASSALSSEEQLLKKIEKLEDDRVAASKEIYQNYLAAKDVLKQTVNDQKQLSAKERLTANSYNLDTMQGMKEKLADIKAVLNTTDLNDKNIVSKLVKEANELNSKLKEVETAYGQFGRNVGNYDGVATSLGKFKIEVGAITREFGSAREASKTLKEELTKLEQEGKRDSVQAKNLREAYYNLSSAMKDATVSSKAMDEAMDWMESFASISSVNKGITSFFGFDEANIGKNIQDLVALQGVLKGIENIRKQMETKEGVGKILGKGFDKIDSWTFSLKRMIVQTNGVTTATRGLSVAVNLLGKAIKTVMSLGVLVAIESISWAISQAISYVKDWTKGNADLVSSEKELKSTMDVINYTLQQRLALNQALLQAQRINQVEKEIEDEKAYAEAIAKTNEELSRRAKMDPQNATFAKGMENAGRQSGVNDFLQNDEGVTTLGGFSEAAKDIDELMRRYNALSEAVQKNTGLVYKNAEGVEVAHLSASDAKDELNHLEQYLAGNMVGAMQQFDLSTEKGRKGLERFVNGILNSNDTLYKSLLLRLPELVSNNAGKFGDGLNEYLKLIQQFAQQANQELKQLKFEEMAQGILDQADETGKRLTAKRKKELGDRFNTLSTEQKVQQFKLYKDASRALDKMQKQRDARTLKSLKSSAKKEVDVEAEIQRLRVERMKEGLTKQIAQLNQERNEKLKKAKADGVRVGELSVEINETYDQKIEDVKRKHAKEVEAINSDMYSSMLEEQARALDMELDNQIEANNALSKAFEKIGTDATASYAIQGTQSLRKSTQMDMGIVSNRKKSNDFIYRQQAEKKYNEELKKLEAERTQITDSEYKNRKKKLDEELDFQTRVNGEMVEDYKKLIDAMREANMSFDELSRVENAKDNELRPLIKTKEELEAIGVLDDKQKTTLEEINAIIANRTKAYDEQIAQLKEIADLNEKKFNDTQSNLQTKYQGQEGLTGELTKRLDQELYSGDQSKAFNERVTAVRAYWEARINAEEQGIERERELNLQLSQSDYQRNIDAESRNYEESLAKQKEFFDKRLEQITNANMSEEEKETQKTQLISDNENAIVQIKELHAEKIKQIDEKASSDLYRINNNALESRKSLQTDYVNDELNELSKFYSSVSQLERKQPVKNSLGFTNWKETDKNNKQLLASYQAMFNNIQEQRDKLNEKLRSGLIDKTTYDSSMSDLDAFSSELGEKMDQVKDNMSLGHKIQTIIQESQQYLQGVADLSQNILSAVWAAEDAAFEREKEALQKRLEAVEKVYDEMDSRAQEHRDNMNSLEDDIASAQGDARDRLIARYNAEKAAEKEALKEKKKAEKEKEKIEKQQEKLDEEQREKQKERDLIQAAINTAMAVTFAAMNTWPVPAIPMMALAAATGAAQIAAINAKKYATGGVLEGSSHAQGGVKVLGGTAEVEGGEYITNKVTTEKNVEVLDFINSNVKKLDLSDFVKFYYPNVKKYATGGVLEGPSHSDGGIKVLGGMAEVEGGEYITNRVTTENNAEVLDFINSNRKKLDISDFIDFYSSKTQSNVIRSASPHRVFADGGTLPTINNDISMGSQVLAAIEKYSNKPTVVSVTEILDRASDVNNVKVMAGL